MAKATRTAESLSASAIEKFHRLLAGDLSGEFRFVRAIEEDRYRDRTDWERSREVVAFTLRGGDTRLVDRGSGHKQVALSLTPDASIRRSVVPLTWWVGWREEWRPIGKTGSQHCFSFVSASWTLYCAGNNTKETLLLRAEWSRPDGDVPENAAQPHWHVHHRQKASVLEVEETTEGGETESEDGAMNAPLEIQISAADLEHEPRLSPSVQYIETRDIHLGMAGWRHQGAHPKCWQQPFGELESSLRSWGLATLKYIRTQLCFVDLREETPAR